MYQLLKFDAHKGILLQMADGLEPNIQILKDSLQNREDIDPAYRNNEMKELAHYVSYTHLRMEESLGNLIIRNQLAPISVTGVSAETYGKLFSSGTSIAIEIDFARKVELAKSNDLIETELGNKLHQINDLRKWFAHPSRYYIKLDELKNDRDKYFAALSKLEETHKGMNSLFQKSL